MVVDLKKIVFIWFTKRFLFVLLNNSCIFLPIINNAVPEVDIPCRWLHTPGQSCPISYTWGNRLQSPGSLSRNAFESGLLNWNNAPTRIIYYYSNTSNNVINTFNDETNGNRGQTIISCIGNQTIQVEIQGKIYWDIQDDYSINQRCGIAAHEIGHGQSIRYIPSDNLFDALMMKEPPLIFFSTVFTPQPADSALVNQVYH